MKVVFTDPSTSDCLEVNVSPDKTAAQCIEALQSNGHLGPGSYELVANGQLLLPNQSLGAAGVTDGNTVAIVKQERGA